MVSISSSENLLGSSLFTLLFHFQETVSGGDIDVEMLILEIEHCGEES